MTVCRPTKVSLMESEFTHRFKVTSVCPHEVGTLFSYSLMVILGEVKLMTK